MFTLSSQASCIRIHCQKLKKQHNLQSHIFVRDIKERICGKEWNLLELNL